MHNKDNLNPNSWPKKVKPSRTWKTFTNVLIVWRRELQLSTVYNCDLFARYAFPRTQLSHLLHHIHAICDHGESHIYEVQMLSFLQRDEKLRVVCVSATISHGQYTWSCMVHVKVLVLKIVPVDRLSTRAILFGYITTLKNTKDWWNKMIYNGLFNLLKRFSNLKKDEWNGLLFNIPVFINQNSNAYISNSLE